MVVEESLDFSNLVLTVDGSTFPSTPTNPAITSGIDYPSLGYATSWVQATWSDVSAVKSIASSGKITYTTGYGDIWSGSFKISSTARNNWSGSKAVTMKILR
jgi:hypothetical protein